MRVGSIGTIGRKIWHAPGDRNDHARICSPGDKRGELRSIDLDDRVVLCVGIGSECAPASDDRIPLGAAASEAAAFYVGERGFIRCDHAGAGSSFNAHVAQRHPGLHGERAHGFTCVFDHMASSAVGADFPDDSESEILGGYALAQRAIHLDEHSLRLALRKALSGEHVLHFRSADAECQRTECAVGAGVAVAADDGHAGLSESEFGADYVDDALVGRVHIEEMDTEFAAVGLQGFDLAQCDWIENWSTAGFGWDIVINRCDGALGGANFASSSAQAIERLWRRDLVNEVQIHVQEGGLASRLCYDVLVPDFFEECS